MFKSIFSWFLATIPAIVPWLAFFGYRTADHSIQISKGLWDTEYDYIIVGAGTAGCIVANRLSEDPSVKVLLLEAGGSDSNIADIPQAVFMLQETAIDWKFRTVPQKYACYGLEKNRMKWPRGKVLGGTSVINFMMYVRGNRVDFDNWAASGATGWSYKEVLPYFKKSEDNQDPDIAYNGYHGRGGLMNVKRTPYKSPMAYTFLEAGKSLGYNLTDVNGPKQVGVWIPQSMIRRGGRCSSYLAYLYPIRDRRNLHVVTFAHVTKVLLNYNNVAVGVNFERFGEKFTVHARKEVILSAGAVNSPQLLMLSGIGSKIELSRHGIPVLVDLPGVGKNLQDHYYSFGVDFIADKSLKPYGETWTYRQEEVQTIPNILMNMLFGKGPMTSKNGLDAMGFIRTKFANKSEPFMPDFQMNFIAGCLTGDGGKSMRKALGITDFMYESVFAPFANEECYTILPVLMKPKSFGYITLKSNNPKDHPIIQPRYFSDSRDLDAMAAGLKFAFQLALSAPFKAKFNSRPTGAVVPGCEHYLLYSTDYMKCVAQTLTATMYHSVGTCKMGNPKELFTVLDPQLRVKGVKNLRVIDGSVMPEITSGNTNAPIMMIAEKGADMIKGIDMTPNIDLMDYMQLYANEIA